MDDELYDRLRRAQLLPRLAAQELLRQQHQLEKDEQTSRYLKTQSPPLGRTRLRQLPDDSSASFADDEGDAERSLVYPHGAVPSGTPGWLEEVIQNVSSASPSKQIAIGGASGWCSGFIVSKVGKAAVLALGGSLIILQVAHWQGLIQVNWTSIEESVSTTRRQLSQRVDENMPALTTYTRDFAQRNMYLASSFGIGFLLGIVL